MASDTSLGPRAARPPRRHPQGASVVSRFPLIRPQSRAGKTSQLFLHDWGEPVIRPRSRPDGLPFRVYERKGKHRYSIGYKNPDGTWEFRLQCSSSDQPRIQALRREAISRSTTLRSGKPAEDSFQAVCNAWFDWQERLPNGSMQKRAQSTLSENRREANMLCKAWGTWRVAEIKKGDAYDYLDACLLARDSKGQPRPRAAKGNKEIALGRVILEYAVRTRRIDTNPFNNVEKLATQKRDRYVTDAELALALEVGRRMGGPQHIVALALKTAFLCVRRSIEVRGLTRSQIKADGIEWQSAKRQRGEAAKLGMIEWSPELKKTVDEALSFTRWDASDATYVFGNMRGEQYTKGGWKATLEKLMNECVQEAIKRKIKFEKFSLQDCRPKGVSDKMARGDLDVVDATMHSSERMVRQVYDRRRIRIAKPAG